MLYNLFENRDFVSVFAVALLAEGVDRNQLLGFMYDTTLVALLAEGVDRNNELYADMSSVSASPSSRRAWIEIPLVSATMFAFPVALLAEGVDRNIHA